MEIVNGPDYSPPPRPRIPVHAGYVQPWGAEVAFEMGDSYYGLEHAFLSMLRDRDTVPARALATLADLDALEAAILEAKNAAASGPPGNGGCVTTFQPPSTWVVVCSNGGGAPGWDPTRHGFHTYVDELVSWLSVKR